ncbi:MAG TPA: hypothetical protein VJ011_04990 [Steroidobacteraceae bacterium]|nr:hypothetical protein [Steroidobacteraceae bacterium]
MIHVLRRPSVLVTLPLVLVILATRVDHFGSAVSLPDATLAAFFLAGLWARARWPFLALLATAGLADQWAFLQGASAWCVTPAYVFLAPAYACLSLAGRVSRNFSLASLAGHARLAVTVLAACAVAFLISNGSFFLFSGYFAAMSATEYWRATARYFLPYTGWAMAYVAFALAAAAVLSRTVRAARADAGA